MMSELSTQERFKRGAPDAGRYFAFMSDFVGFTAEHAEAIRETRFVIEKHIPAIVGQFYAQVLSFPATRKHFLKPDGTLDQAYLALRMQHQAGFWRRTAAGVFDEDYRALSTTSAERTPRWAPIRRSIFPSATCLAWWGSWDSG